MSRDPNLRPREHGAYAMLTFPIVSGLAMGGLSWAGVAFATLAVTGFLAHESVLVVTGARGERIRSNQAAQARRRLFRLVGVAVVAAIVFSVTASPAAWRVAVLPASLGVVVGALLLARKTKSLLGEILVAATFSSVHAVAAAAGGADARVTFLPVLTWVVCFWLATLSVHALKYRFKGRGGGRWAVSVAPVFAGAMVVLGGLGALDLFGGVDIAPGRDLAAAAASALPKAAVILLLSMLPANPRHLKRIGWTFVVADTLALAILVWGVR